MKSFTKYILFVVFLMLPHIRSIIDNVSIEKYNFRLTVTFNRLSIHDSSSKKHDEYTERIQNVGLIDNDQTDIVPSFQEIYEVRNSTQQWNILLLYSGPDPFLVDWLSVVKLNDSNGDPAILLTGTSHIQNNTDQPGEDYFDFTLPQGSTHIDCERACQSDRIKCRAWSYVRAGVQDPTRPRCWLKNAIPQTPVSSSCCISGQMNQSILLQRQITLTVDGPLVLHTISTNSSFYPFVHYDDWYRFIPGRPEFIHSASIKFQEIDFVPHWQFKSPVVMFQNGPHFAALIPRVDQLDARYLRIQPTNLDLINPTDRLNPQLGYGIAHSALTRHSVYSRSGVLLVLNNTLSFTLFYNIILSSTQEKMLGYREVTKRLWEWYGVKLLHSMPQQQTNLFNSSLNLFDTWRAHAWTVAAQQYYFDFDCGDPTLRCSSIASRRNRWADHEGTDEDAWFNAWFQHLRSAFGMYLYGLRTNSSKLMKQAQGTLLLALKAPQNRGVFPSIFWLAKNQSMYWVDDSGWAGLCNTIPKPPPPHCKDYYHTFDMTWTAYWMLRWGNELKPELLPTILKYVIPLGDFLVTHQKSNGLIPSWYDAYTFQPAVQFSNINAEVSTCALFLAELYNSTTNPKYLSASKKALDYIQKFIIPERKWFDFETFVSCSPKPFDFYDPFTSQYPQNTLSKFQAAFAFMRVFELTKDQRYLSVGESIVDFTSLTQQVFNHPLLTPIMVGGFTTQNTDAEWSDARQAYAADMYLWYYERTGKLEYLQRGIAALRATLPIAPFENWAHTGGSEGDFPGSISSFHWGTGSAATSIELHLDKFGDGYVNAALKHAIGVNGCTIDNLQISSNTLKIEVFSPYQWKSPFRLVVDAASSTLRVIVNNIEIGTFNPRQLKQGIMIPGNIIESHF